MEDTACPKLVNLSSLCL